MPKAVVVTGCALLFGVVSSATFLTTNVVGNKVLGLDQKAAKEVSNTTQNKASLTKTSSVVTSDVSSVVESVMPSIVSITNMSVPVSYTHLRGIDHDSRVCASDSCKKA